MESAEQLILGIDKAGAVPNEQHIEGYYDKDTKQITRTRGPGSEGFRGHCIAALRAKRLLLLKAGVPQGSAHP